MARFKNPWAGTAYPAVAEHLILKRGWTVEQLNTWYADLWDRLGLERRRRVLNRYGNLIVRAWVMEDPTMWVDHLGRTVAHRLSKSGKTVSSTIVIKAA